MGGYECIEAQGVSVEPQWPEEDSEKLLKIAFRERFIRNLDHPLLRQLLGLSLLESGIINFFTATGSYDDNCQNCQ